MTSACHSSLLTSLAPNWPGSRLLLAQAVRKLTHTFTRTTADARSRGEGNEWRGESAAAWERRGYWVWVAQLQVVRWFTRTMGVMLMCVLAVNRATLPFCLFLSVPLTHWAPSSLQQIRWQGHIQIQKPVALWTGCGIGGSHGGCSCILHLICVTH